MCGVRSTVSRKVHTYRMAEGEETLEGGSGGSPWRPLQAQSEQNPGNFTRSISLHRFDKMCQNYIHPTRDLTTAGFTSKKSIPLSRNLSPVSVTSTPLPHQCKVDCRAGHVIKDFSSHAFSKSTLQKWGRGDVTKPGLKFLDRVANVNTDAAQ